MLIKSVILENFRAYKERIEVPVDTLTAFIGRNDAGKSSILEALDIFFEGGTIKIEGADTSKGGDPKAVRIGVVFTNLPDQLVLDADAPTTLANEYLLNESGHLEIHKVFNCGAATPQCSIHARAIHPTAEGVADVLQKTQKDLKVIVKDKGLQKQCNLNENPSMRYAIYKAQDDLQLKPCDVALNKDNAKAVWSALQRYLPLFALFQSDRASNDQDPEIQNPMKLAIERALAQLEKDLDNITEQVRLKAQETAERTLAKLQATYPDLASTLEPKFKKPTWKNIFKLDLEADDGIPLNKRGSGVRRLVLMSFFQAEAEKRRADDTPAGMEPRSVVYAVEEPETSQHPESQEQIIRVLRALSDGGDQVLLTTHVPGLAGLVPVKNLRYVDKDPATKAVRVREGSADVYAEIAEGLGVLPDPVQKPGLKVAVLVEGKNDIDALRSMAMVLAAAGEVVAFDETQIFWTIGGGDTTLKDWIERRYLEKLGVPQVIIQDSDRSAAAVPLVPSKADWLRDMTGLPKVTPFLTRKRCMDNYVHPDAIVRTTGGKVALPAAVDVDFGKIAEELGPCLRAANAAGLVFVPDDHSGEVISGTAKSPCKRMISAYFMRHMTANEFRQRATYTNATGDQVHEIREWLDAIAAHLR
jgi:putative ATP-dependent endonuclease of the OLD family